MSLPYARTFDEIYLYLDLRPCVCGETQLDERVSTSVVVDGEPAERISGQCASCGRPRQFTFRMPPGPPEVSFEISYGGDEPSRLLDPGEWLGVSELYGVAADEQTRDLDPADDEAVTRAYYLLASSLAAVDEVLKFLPAGAAEVPEGAFWSQAGRMVYETSAERFERDRLTAERAEIADRVAEFEQRYGASDDADAPDATAERG
ncbi:hypothetical protein [Actinocatenispora rupis]|uniref:CpXC protein n=1 Tax=Actinocatenispora rupis TaxID=519421 RepID=A0A8J3J7Q7_9ACTN|nr:hypothetical protein [Actinocatenispora rupis]GID13555.1 hypothetical protein Aru02nite_44440 [Actinocatenispora rupis]